MSIELIPHNYPDLYIPNSLKSGEILNTQYNKINYNPLLEDIINKACLLNNRYYSLLLDRVSCLQEEIYLFDGKELLELEDLSNQLKTKLLIIKNLENHDFLTEPIYEMIQDQDVSIIGFLGLHIGEIHQSIQTILVQEFKKSSQHLYR